MRKIEKAIIIALILSVIIGSFSAFASDCRNIRNSVLRLHILANSDSAEDQALKLKVRDRILSETQALFQATDDLVDAENKVSASMDLVKQIAVDEIQKQGYFYDVQVELCNMYFGTRKYDGIALPAGSYDAMRVTIGEGKGQNWWCVLYPPLCIPAAQPTRELKDVLSPSETEIVTSQSKYEIRFACVELWERLKEAIRK